MTRKLNHDERRARRLKPAMKVLEAAIRRRPYHRAERCVLESLKRCYHGQGRIYAGDHKLAGPVGKRDPKTGKKMRWTLGERNFCSPITIWRGKTRLERARVLQLVHTRGGYTRNPKGELVRAATGYEVHPDLYAQGAAHRSASMQPDATASAAAPAGSLEEYIAARQAEGGRAGP